MCFILLPACLLFISLIYVWYNRLNSQIRTSKIIPVQQDLLYRCKLIIDWWGLIRFLIRKSRFQFCHRRLHNSSAKLWVKSVRFSEMSTVSMPINRFADKPIDQVTLKLPIIDTLKRSFKMKTYRHDDESNITSMQEIML